MPFLIGITLALLVSGYATAIRLDRGRAFYATLVVVVASFYVLFAAMSGSGRAVAIEALIAGGFVVAASLGFRRSSWILCAGLAAHGLLDAVHAHVVTNVGVPAWWPAFCGSYDLAAAGYLAWRLVRTGAAPGPRGAPPLSEAAR